MKKKDGTSKIEIRERRRRREEEREEEEREKRERERERERERKRACLFTSLFGSFVSHKEIRYTVDLIET